MYMYTDITCIHVHVVDYGMYMYSVPFSALKITRFIKQVKVKFKPLKAISGKCF